MGLFQTMSLLQLSQCWFRHLKSVCCDCYDFPVLQVLLVVLSVVVLWCSALLYLHISAVGISESQHCQLAVFSLAYVKDVKSQWITVIYQTSICLTFIFSFSCGCEVLTYCLCFSLILRLTQVVWMDFGEPCRRSGAQTGLYLLDPAV